MPMEVLELIVNHGPWQFKADKAQWDPTSAIKAYDTVNMAMNNAHMYTKNKMDIPPLHDNTCTCDFVGMPFHLVASHQMD